MLNDAIPNGGSRLVQDAGQAALMRDVFHVVPLDVVWWVVIERERKTLSYTVVYAE